MLNCNKKAKKVAFFQDKSMTRIILKILTNSVVGIIVMSLGETFLNNKQWYCSVV